MELVSESSQLTISEYEGAALILQALREAAEAMPLDSELRGLALRSATRWQRVVELAPARLSVVSDAEEVVG